MKHKFPVWHPTDLATVDLEKISPSGSLRINYRDELHIHSGVAWVSAAAKPNLRREPLDPARTKDAYSPPVPEKLRMCSSTTISCIPVFNYGKRCGSENCLEN